MTRLHFLDTNVLLYSVSRDPNETEKRRRAVGLLERDGAALSVQVLQEFYVQATRSTRADRIAHETAVGFIECWTRFKVQEITLAILSGALEIKADHGFSYWDSAILAAARALGCREVYTEDMAHGREIDDMIIVNPFR